MGIISENISGDTISVEIESSNLKLAVYHTKAATLTVTFNNEAIYEYKDVPWELFTKLRMAESQGRFFNQNISKAFKYERVYETKNNI
jgi:hypothetical protein